MAGGLGQILGVAGQTQGLLGLFPGPMRAEQYNMNRLTPNAIPDPVTLVNMYVSGIIDTEKYKLFMRCWGYDENFASLMYSLSVQRPPIADLINLWRRGEVPEKILDTEFERVGVSGYYKYLFMKATEYFPPPPDLIRFAVREVYTPETVRLFGMGQDMPPQFLTEAKKTGLPAEQAYNYWKAHWILPSAQQGFEMFQREIITRDQLNLLLKSLDIMPFWRDNLTKMAYNVVTRVDARRMYRMGVYDQDRLLKAYKHMGYSPEDAEDMTEFTVRMENPEVEGLSRAAVIGAYKRDIITVEELTQFLTQLNYPEHVVQFWVENAEWEKTVEDFDVILGEYQDQYLSGVIDENDLRTELNRLDLHPASVDAIIEKLNKKRIRQRKIPTKAELTDWLQANIISDEQYFVRMRLLGYSDEDIRNYMTFVLISRESTGRRFLDDEIYVGWFVHGILSREELEKIFIAKQYSTKDTERLLAEAEGSREQLQNQNR